MLKFISTLAFALCVTSISVKAQTWEKVSVGLSAPPVVDVARNNQNHIFITLSHGDVYRSLDSGATWSRVLYVPSDYVNVVGVNPISQHVFVGFRNGSIYRSTDNGNNWLKVAQSFGGFWDVAFDGSGNIVFAAGDFGNSGFIVRSTDDGNTWTSSTRFATANRVIGVAVTPSGTILAESVSNGVYRSTDNGQTWSLSNAGLTSLEGVPERSMSVINGNVYTCTDVKLFRSTDDGINWTVANSGNTTGKVLRNPLDGYLFAKSGPSIYRSTDSGSTWVPFSSTTDNITGWVMMPSGRMLAGTQVSVEVSVNGGSVWTTSTSGLDASQIEGLITSSSGFIIAGSQQNGIYRSTNAGLSWQNVYKVGNNGINMANTITANGIVYIPYNNGISRSNDEGATWTTLQSGLNTYCPSFAINSSNGNFYAGTWDKGVYRSTDQGSNWASTGTFPSAGGIEGLLVKSDGTLFGVTSGVLYRSTDAGANWNNITPIDAGYLQTIGFDQSENLTIGSHQSTDNGSSWIQTPGTTNGIKTITRFANGIIYAGGGDGIWMSLDNGSSWKIIPLNGIDYTNVHSITYRPTDGKIYIGTNGGGIFRSALGTQLVATTVSAPASGATGVSLTPSISWGNVTGSDSFMVQISTSSTFSTITSQQTVKNSPLNISTALSPGTIYYVRVRASDNIGGSGWSTTVNFTTVFNPPSFTVSPNFSPTTPSEGQAITVTADIGNFPTSVILTYGKGGETSGTDAAMTLTTGTTYSGTIPTSAVTAKGVWYRVRAVNNGGTTYSPSQTGKNNITITITNIATVKASGQYPTGIPTNGYYSVGLPVNTTIDLSSIFGAPDPKVWKAWYAQDSAFVETTTMDNPTRGYIILHRSASPKDLTITSSTTNAITAFDNISLSPGWNFISWPYAFTASVSLTSSLIGSMWLYNGKSGWQSTTQLKPFGAYAVYNKTGSAITAGSAVTWTPIAKAIVSSSQDWSLRLKIQAGDYSDNDNYVGLSQSNSGALDEPEPFYIDDYVSGYFVSENKRYASKFSDQEGQVFDFAIYNNTAVTAVSKTTLTWDFGSDAIVARAIDLNQNRVIDLNANFSYEFTTTHRATFKIILGNVAFVENQVTELTKYIPTTFAVSQNFPNPFNPTTTIKFDVPRAANIKLKIYNVLGQEVATLADGFFDTGHHTITWNAKDSQGREVASGLYIYRITVRSLDGTKQNFAESKKMILLK